MSYNIIYAFEAREHLRSLSARDRRIVVDAISEQLRHEPTVVTRRRKPLRANPLAPWELRVGPYRVYFDVAQEPIQEVRVLAVGRKKRDLVLIGKEEIRL